MATQPEDRPAPSAPAERHHDPRSDLEAGLREARAQFEAANQAINKRSGRNLPAAIGIGTRMAWLHAPRPLIIPLYIALGWVAVFVLPQILHNGGVAALVLLLVGGLFYSLGAVVYAVRRPDPVPTVFGYHEVFHLCTLLAAICHYIAIYFALFS